MTLNVFTHVVSPSPPHKTSPAPQADNKGFIYHASLELPPNPRQGTHYIASSIRVDQPISNPGPQALTASSMCRVHLLTDNFSEVAEEKDPLSGLNFSTNDLLEYTTTKRSGDPARRILCPWLEWSHFATALTDTPM